MQYLLHLKLAHNIPVHTKLSILYIVFVPFLHIVFLNICILLFLLSVSCPDAVNLLHCGASVSKTNSSYVKTYLALS